MAEAAKDQDQSMEDILQSIKRIIAEEGEPASTSAGSDVLELTELLAEDGSISKATQGERAAIPSISIDEIMAAPVSSGPTPPPAPEPAPAPVAEAPAAPEPAPQPEPAVAAEPEESLISNAALSASVSALNALRDSLSTPPSPARMDSPSFRSGVTVEDLVRESLKPMLKEWLDANLPSLVESLVRKEISKLSQR